MRYILCLLILLSACATEQEVTEPQKVSGVISLREGTISESLFVKLLETAEERQVILENVYLTWLILWRSEARKEKLSLFKVEGFIRNLKQVRVEILDLDFEIWADGKRLSLEDKYYRFERFLDPGCSSHFKMQGVSPVITIVDLQYDVKLEWGEAE